MNRWRGAQRSTDPALPVSCVSDCGHIGTERRVPIPTTCPVPRAFRSNSFQRAAFRGNRAALRGTKFRIHRCVPESHRAVDRFVEQEATVFGELSRAEATGDRTSAHPELVPPRGARIVDEANNLYFHSATNCKFAKISFLRGVSCRPRVSWKHEGSSREKGGESCHLLEFALLLDPRRQSARQRSWSCTTVSQSCGWQSPFRRESSQACARARTTRPARSEFARIRRRIRQSKTQETRA